MGNQATSTPSCIIPALLPVKCHMIGEIGFEHHFPGRFGRAQHPEGTADGATSGFREVEIALESKLDSSGDWHECVKTATRWNPSRATRVTLEACTEPHLGGTTTAIREFSMLLQREEVPKFTFGPQLFRRPSAKSTTA